MMKVKNMVNNNGRAVANQYVLTDEENYTKVFQSYDETIVAIDYKNKVITVYPAYDYSRTTVKYRNLFMYQQFFAEMSNSKDFERCLKNGKVRDFKIVKA